MDADRHASGSSTAGLGDVGRHAHGVDEVDLGPLRHRDSVSRIAVIQQCNRNIPAGEQERMTHCPIVVVSKHACSEDTATVQHFGGRADPDCAAVATMVVGHDGYIDTSFVQGLGECDRRPEAGIS